MPHTGTLFSHVACSLWPMGSPIVVGWAVVMARGLSCSTACGIWSDCKGNGLLPLVTPDLSRREEALLWFWSQLLRYSFCGVCGNELEGLALIARGQKSLFPCFPALHHLFCCHISPWVAPEEEQKSGRGFNGEDAIFHTLLLGCFCLCYIF